MKELKNVEEQYYIICDVDEEYILKPEGHGFSFIPYYGLMQEIELFNFNNYLLGKPVAERFIEAAKEDAPNLISGAKRKVIERGLKVKPIKINLKVEL